MGDELLGIVFEAEELITGGGVDVGGELVLDALPGGKVRGVLVAVLPDGAPGLEDGPGCGSADLSRGGESLLQEAADHQGVGLRIEGVELGRDVGLGADMEFGDRGWGRLDRRVGGAVARRGRRGRGRRGGGGGAEKGDFGEGESGVVLGFVLNGRLGLEDLRGLLWWVQMMGVEVVVREEVVFGFVGIHGKMERRERWRGREREREREREESDD
ncbi:hypothetical protein CIPAW_02G167100 [Carya illinoinensis]|uniref:Uncharacterized protein n=1 Tax=Carya illinoinensis TaxID=32201 RepID=A0A8T1RFA5_CARIL|nr:hypothetical protein CIPAW_02G167100 [Carya illinoinensis]